MTVRVGVIGVGMIGKDHVRRLRDVLSGGSVVAINDVDPGRAHRVADRVPGARVYDTGEQIIAAHDVDAVLVASWGPTHEQYILAAIAADKPVFCEKPLATTQEACLRILDAETTRGHRLVQVGFMRRYDDSYRALKAAVDDGVIGAPMLVHSTHRNAGVPASFTSDMAINDTAVHDIDVLRWLLGEEIVATRVLRPRRNRFAAEHLVDPLIIILETANGVIADVEVNVNVGYGYDIRGEVVGEKGTAALGDRSDIMVRSAGAVTARVPGGWSERFVRAYDTELQAWLDAVATGSATGPGAWDGYAAAVVADSCLDSMRTGERYQIRLRDRPTLYAENH